MKKIKDFYSSYFSDLLEILRKPVVSVLPGHLSFFLLLSFIPLIIIFGIVADRLSISFQSISDFISSSLPADTSMIIKPLFDTDLVGLELALLVISAIFLASRATKAIIKTANNIYGVRKNGVKDVIKSIIITTLIIVLFVFIALTLVLGEKILLVLVNLPSIGHYLKDIHGLINVFKWPIALFVIFFTIKIVYTLTPNKKIKSKTVNKGSLFTTIAWSILTFIYSFYVTNYASYNDYYGSASNIVILMLWVYLISQIFVIGMIMNYLDDKKNEEK